MKFGEGESNYIKGSDLNGREVPVVIDEMRQEELGQGRDAENKWILYFVGKKKGMVLNLTNQRMLMDLFGTPSGDTDEAVSAHFSGKNVILYFDKNVSFGGKLVGGLRLRGADGGQAPAPDPAAGDNPAHAPEPPMPESDHAPTAQESDIPF